ncbi:dephospho-CoA kinase [Desulfosarcina widdelii]|uniref:Dephospho-CoA kinase n=1 Tax=Desulfosarcina widdelii TaxID=947919 RepID=A0A5K7Z0U3_9BACT|nr:dephospho-CoA kinase [Desulfosarcina widdelii]BBO74315.1 dephospho-CoA kinase [Desulfosarcina widdelii]
MIVAGLTGGIATGKSTVSNFLSEAGARIIDADKIAREVVEQGTPAYDEIRAFFGEEVLMPNGDIDRERLGDIIFNDSDKKKRLDAIVHPRVFERSAVLIAEIAASEPDAVVILDIPLLLEANMDRDLTEVIVVYVPETMQLQRLMARDGIDEKAAMARIRSQMPIEEKRKQATCVIDNSGSRSACRQQALKALDRLRQKASEPG